MSYVAMNPELRSALERSRRLGGQLPLGDEVWSLRGPEREAFLNNYNSQDILKTKPGVPAYGAFLTQKGKLVSDAWILRRSEEFLLLLPSGYGEALRKHLEIFLNFADVELKPRTARSYLLFGPEAEAWIEKTTSEALLYPSARFGTPSWELVAEKPPAELECFPEDLGEYWRIRAGLPKMGVDMQPDQLIAETGQEARAVSFQKGCYLGQEPTARIQSRGHVNRKLFAVDFSGAPVGPLPLTIEAEGKSVGLLSSLLVDETECRGIALLELKATQGTLSIRQEGKNFKISVFI